MLEKIEALLKAGRETGALLQEFNRWISGVQEWRISEHSQTATIYTAYKITYKDECVVSSSVPHHEGDGATILSQHIGPHLAEVSFQPENRSALQKCTAT
jgi:hypothetical protein